MSILLRFITADTPTAKLFGGISFNTTAFAPITEECQILMGPSSFAPAPI
jgi:hypothetical protein